MKRFLVILVVVLSVSIALIGCSNLEEQRAENAIKKYYEALMEEDYEAAVKQVYLYEEDFLNTQTSISTKEAKAIYLKKMNHLKDQNYKFKDFKIIEVEYEDGHSFWHHVIVEVEHNGQIEKYEEQVFFREGKLKISGEDPYIQYRDGKMDVELIQ